ncbi:MAG: type II secretion system protein GspD [Rubripirellula sp.]
MDGNSRPSQFCRALAITAILASSSHHLAAAEIPPLFIGEGASRPIDSKIAEVDAAPVKSKRRKRSTLVRPQARVIRVSDSALVPMTDQETDTSATIAPLSPVLQNRFDTPHPISVEEALETKGSITFRKTELSEVVFLLSDLWHINIVAGENISGEVSGAFHDAPLREVLSAALTAAGYSYKRTGNSLVVLPIEQVGTDDPDFKSETILLPPSLRGEDSTLAAAQLLLSERGQLQKIGEDAVLVVDSVARVDRVRQLFADLAGQDGSQTNVPEVEVLQDEAEPSDGRQFAATSVTRSGIAYFSPQFTEASEMAQPLRDALGDTVVVAVYPEENRILVKGTAEDLRLASEAIEQLDRPRPQVRITAMIYDVSLKEIERLGVDWSVQPHSRSLTLTDLNDAESLRFRNAISASTGLVTDPSAAGAANLAVSTINNSINVDTLLQALDSTSEAKLLADPSITVGDRHEASIRIVQKIPILAADPVENSGVVFSQVQFEEAGVILNVQPRISRDGTIELTVQPEYSVVADFIENNPVIDSRTAQTTVRVTDGQTFAIGGLRQKSIVETVRGVPGLRDIKYIGKLFRSHDTEIRESELIVFLKPEIVTPYFGGTPREQAAACMTRDVLDAIPHADNVPQTPCCYDGNCPNHHPRPRINGGSQSLEMFGGSGVSNIRIENIEVLGAENVEVIESETVEPNNAINEHTFSQTKAANSAAVVDDRLPGVVIREVHPPLHIATEAITNEGR